MKRSQQLTFTLDAAHTGQIAGVDEVGRGPLAGDVVAAAVILPPGCSLPGLNDSKLLSERKREHLFDLICSTAVSWSVARATVAEIDELNILQASLLAMTRAVQNLAVEPGFVYVDGNRCPRWQYRSEAVVKGDSRILSIAAASVLAKVTRDRELVALDACYPGYGLARHKGYPTAEHLQALQALGVTPLHRRSFAPVARLLETPGVKLSKSS
jgi:ribonuclease HII